MCETLIVNGKPPNWDPETMEVNLIRQLREDIEQMKTDIKHWDQRVEQMNTEIKQRDMVIQQLKIHIQQHQEIQKMNQRVQALEADVWHLQKKLARAIKTKRSSHHHVARLESASNPDGSVPYVQGGQLQDVSHPSGERVWIYQDQF